MVHSLYKASSGYLKQERNAHVEISTISVLLFCMLRDTSSFIFQKEGSRKRENTHLMIELNTTSLSIVPTGTELSPFFRGKMPLPPSVDNAYKIITIRTKNGPITTLGATPALDQFKIGAAWMLTQA